MEENNKPRPTISQEKLDEFVRYVISSLVVNKDKVEVVVMQDLPGTYTVHIRVDAYDRGRVIGKNGKTINALRTILRIFGRVVVLLEE